MQVEVLTYAPTEFYHCQHCELVWDGVGLGRPIRAEQRAAGLPPDLQTDYQALADWVADARRRYGERLQVRVVDVASVQGVIAAIRHRVRRFPAFIVDGRERIIGFDRARLEAALAERLGSTRRVSV
jgi:hypothetical protein